MLRKALGETPEQRYILTIQGRGYRFADEVKEVSSSFGLAPDTATPRPRTEDLQPKPTDHHPRKKMWLVTGVVLLVLIAALTAYFRWSNSRIQALESQRVTAGGLAVPESRGRRGTGLLHRWHDGRNDHPAW